MILFPIFLLIEYMNKLGIPHSFNIVWSFLLLMIIAYFYRRINKLEKLMGSVPEEDLRKIFKL